MSKIKWTKARCPVCGCEYEYPEGGYKPATCSKFECLHKHAHRNLPGGANSVNGSGRIAKIENRRKV